VLFEPSLEPFAETEGLAASEFQLLADASLELAARYERDAAYMDDEEGRQLALMLSKWRQRRGRYFQELSARAERSEAVAMSQLDHGLKA
jgi:hypothetical protein